MTQVQADKYCGSGFRYENGGCAAICAQGQQFDPSSATCIKSDQLAEVAQSMGIELGENETLGCPPGFVLVLESAQHASCVPAEHSCSRDERWDGSRCVKATQCPLGTVLNTTTNSCENVISDDKTRIVDLQAWTWSTYGSPGQQGTPKFCSGFNRKPSAFAVKPGSSITVTIEVKVNAATKKAAEASVVTEGIVKQTSLPVTPQGAAAISHAAQDLLQSLQAHDAVTSTPAAQTSVHCRIVNAAKLPPVPESGGF